MVLIKMNNGKQLTMGLNGVHIYHYYGTISAVYMGPLE